MDFISSSIQQLQTHLIMGIKSLNSLLKKYDEIYEPIHLSELAYTKIAIDTSLFIYKYKFAAGDKWLYTFMQLITALRRNEVHCVFIFDSQATPDKKLTQEKRRQDRQKDCERIFKLVDAMTDYHNTGNISKCLTELHDKLVAKGKGGRLLGKGMDMKMVESYIEKCKSRTVDVQEEDFEIAKQLFSYLSIPYFLAPVEAETMCSDLCKRGIVDAVLSEDTDVIAYQAPCFLCKIDMNSDTCMRVKYDQVLESLELTPEAFLDVCIMCGTDYNSNIEGVGAINAYKLIKTHGSIEGLETYLSDMTNKLSKLESKCVGKISTLNHIRVRELFTQYEKADIAVKHCGKPDWGKIESFLSDNGCPINVQNFKRHFDPPEIVFDDDIVEEDDDVCEEECIEDDNEEIEIK